MKIKFLWNHKIRTKLYKNSSIEALIKGMYLKSVINAENVLNI